MDLGTIGQKIADLRFAAGQIDAFCESRVVTPDAGELERAIGADYRSHADLIRQACDLADGLRDEIIRFHRDWS